MPEHEARAGRGPGWRGLTHSLAVRLVVLLLGGMALIFAILGFLILSQHRRHLERATLASADRVSDVIERSTSYCMLRNDREGLLHIIDTIAAEPGVVGIRVYNEEGRISLSTTPDEEGTIVSKEHGTCSGCHASGRPLAEMKRMDRFSIYRLADGPRVLGVINPIENHRDCWSAACHAHPPDRKILGVLETRLSLAGADALLAEGNLRMEGYMLLAAALISIFSGAFVWRVVHRPVRALKVGTARLAQGDLGYQIALRRRDELGELALSFNRMSRLLEEARDEADSWARTLETRVEEKSRELQLAHDHVVHVEKMASLGKLAATVAHEINNPLSGILTYAKLLGKWVGRAETGTLDRAGVLDALQVIETESRRCGEIVRNLLMFSRSAPMNVEPTDLNAVVTRCITLVNHKMELAGAQLELALAEKLPKVPCDPAQMEQVLLALAVNAVEAMPHGGTLTMRTSSSDDPPSVLIEVSDDGPGIPPEMLASLFEPFFTTKERGAGVGLGLAVSRQIVQRHHGEITVRSEPGHGTTFTVRIPLAGATPTGAEVAEGLEPVATGGSS